MAGELRLDNHIIRHDCTSAEWAELERKLRELGPHELEALAASYHLLGPQSWRDLLNEVTHDTWMHFIRTYEGVTRQTYDRAIA